jgi:hypothetical protein
MPAPKTQQAQKEKAINQGNLAEAVLGAAIVAKLVLRQPNGKIGKVTPVEIKNVLKQICKVPGLSKGGKKTQIKLDSGGAAKDRITFYLNLGASMTAALQKMKDLSVLNKVCDAAASYANMPYMESTAESLYNNQIDNKIEIDVDGISDNKGTKADIAMWTDKHVFDKISLKAGKVKAGHSLGQIGGNSWASILRLFHEGYNPKTQQKESGLGLSINTPQNEFRYMTLVTQKPTFTTVGKAVLWAYQMANGVFRRCPQSTLATNVYKFLKFHATRDDTDVKIVMLHLGKGTHKTLNPLLLEQKLKDVDLRAVTRMDTRWPVFLVYDAAIGIVPTTANSSSTIFSIRPKMDLRTTGYIVHLVEEGPRFSAMIEEEGA